MYKFDLITFGDLITSLGPTMAYMKAIAIKLLFLFFVVSLIIEQFKAISDEPNYLSIIFSVVLYFVIMAIYPTIMIHTYEICTDISKQIFSDDNFFEFISRIQKNISDSNASFWEITKGGITGIVTWLSFCFISLAINLLLIVRLVLLGFIYCVTPLVCTMIVFRAKFKVISTIFVTIISVCLWSVIANLFLKVLFVVVGNFYNSDVNILVIISANVIVSVFMLSTPTIAFQIVNAESFAAHNMVQQVYYKLRDLSMVSAGFATAKSLTHSAGRWGYNKVGNQVSKAKDAFISSQTRRKENRQSNQPQ